MSEAELIKDSWIHVSQSVGRLPVTQPQAPCLLSNSLVYSLERDCTLSGMAHMKMIGWPEEFLPGCCSDAEYRDMAGNAFSCPIATIVSVAMIMQRHAPWWLEEG